MSTFLTVVLVAFALLGLLVLVFAIWVSSKVRKGKAHLAVHGLSMGLDALKQHAAKPEQAGNQELAALVTRTQTAHDNAKAALDKGDFNEAFKIVVPAIEELAKFKSALDEERARQASQAASQTGSQLDQSNVIDVVAEEVKPVLQLPAPADTAADTTGGAGGKDDSKK